MVRIFMALSGFAILLLIAVSLIVHSLSVAEIERCKNNAVIAKLKGVSLNISTQIEFLEKILNNISHSPLLLTAVKSKEAISIQKAITPFENNLPGVMKLRLLLPGKQLPDKTNIPHLGFADIEMVKRGFTTPQVPAAIQGTEANRHLGIIHQVLKENKVVGVLLASFHYDFLQKALRNISVENMYAELRQGSLVLSKIGDNSLKHLGETGQAKIKGTNWIIYYWAIPTHDMFYMSLLAATVLIPILLLCLATFIAFRRETAILHKDQNVVVNVVRGLLKGKTHGNHPVAFNEMKILISNLLQLQRVSATQQAKLEGGSESELANLLNLIDTDNK